MAGADQRVASIDLATATPLVITEFGDARKTTFGLQQRLLTHGITVVPLQEYALRAGTSPQGQRTQDLADRP